MLQEIKEGEKRCKKCRIIQPKENFYKNKKIKSGIGSSCKKCSHIYQSAWKIKNNVQPYRIKFPEKWKIYFTSYLVKRNENPEFKLRKDFTRKINQYLKNGDITKSKKCNCCKKFSAKLWNYFANEFIKNSLEKESIEKSEIIKNIRWYCPSCVANNRSKK